MNWFKKIRRYFAETETPPLPEQVALPELLPEPVPEAEELPAEEEDVLPFWLNNDDALKDEGVIYGLSGTDPQEKINIIHSVYKKHSAGWIRVREELNEKIGELNLILEKKDALLHELGRKTEQVRGQEPREENSFRVLTGLILALGMCIGNYFLIREGVRYGFPLQSDPIALGVFLTGMFSLYYTTSVIHSDSPLTWKRTLEEFGMPLAASLFVWVQVVSEMAWYKSAGFFIFTFFAFLIAGKLLLGSIAQLKREIRLFQMNRELKREKYAAATDWLQTMDSLEKEMEKIRMEKWKIVSALNETEAQINRLTADKEAAVNLFISEYNLAKDYKDRLSGAQISKIIR